MKCFKNLQCVNRFEDVSSTNNVLKPVNLSQEAQRTSITKDNPLMHFGETVYSANHEKQINKLCRQNADILYVKASGIYSNHLV